MIKEILVYDSPEDSLNPYRNLAREEVLLRTLRQDQMILYLWQNRDTVVIGKNQNCYRECRVSLLEKEGGHLARRLSGGGAVFHDLGNLNYTFLAMREDFDVPLQTGLIVKAIRGFGIDAAATGRNDIEAEGRKFSGNAYYLTKDACYQHGTLLVRVDPDRIGRYLNVDREKLQAKGVSSVRSRVMGLADLEPELTPAGLRCRLKEVFRDAFPEADFCLLSEGPAGERIEQEALALEAKYAYPACVYGEKASYDYEFGKRFSWGSVQIHLKIHQGKIGKVRIYTDSLGTQWPRRMEEALQDLKFEPESIAFSLLGTDFSVEDREIVSDITQLIEESM